MQDFTPLARLDGPRRAAAQAIAALMIVSTAPAIGLAADPIVLHGRTMGTTYNVKYWTAASDVPAPPDLQRSIDALLARFDEQMSTWRPDSELSRFKAEPAGEWFAVSPETAAVVCRALELHRNTGGASDVTVGPVLRVWGFGAGAKQQNGDMPAPRDAELQLAMKRIGAEHLQVRTDPPGLRKDVEGIEVDLSSIAPGYAIDLIVDQLAAAGIDNAMVELGGEVRGVGARPDGKPWRIGVQCPPPHEATIAQVVPLSNLALATSGDFHNFHAVNGVAYTHIIDPRTGYPLVYRGASVTVVAQTCFAADGVATAIFVMGPAAGYDWCVEHHVAALFQATSADGGESTRRTTPRFEELVGHE
jgi:thiamine biosynthesis lipoprotein